MAKKTRATKTVTAQDIAMQLLDKRSEINLLKKDEKDLTDTLKSLIRSGADQNIYQLRKDMTLAISDEDMAYEWANQHQCLKVYLPYVDKFLKAQRAAVPPGFGLRETEKLVELREKEIAQEEFIIAG